MRTDIVFGEIQIIKSPTVLKVYWVKPRTTAPFSEWRKATVGTHCSTYEGDSRRPCRNLIPASMRRCIPHLYIKRARLKTDILEHRKAVARGIYPHMHAQALYKARPTSQQTNQLEKPVPFV